MSSRGWKTLWENNKKNPFYKHYSAFQIVLKSMTTLDYKKDMFCDVVTPFIYGIVD